MTFDSDDAKRFLTRDVALTDDVVRRDSDPSVQSVGLLASTTTLGSYPTSAQSYYACTPQAILGTEVEGGAGVLTPVGSTFFALNLGTTVPPVGTSVIATHVGSRWVFRYDS